MAKKQDQVELLLIHFEQAFRKKSWHGPNLRGSIRGLTPAQAAWRPATNRHSICEQVLHTAYWKYTIRRRILGEKRGSFALAGSNWIAQPDPLDAAAWKRCVKILEGEHERLRDAIRSIDDRDLAAKKFGVMSARDLIMGITSHDLYHVGQINMIKRLHADG
ncbi:MAG: DinB family protein [Phycisphaerae bacterium]